MPKTCFVVGPIGTAGSETRIHADWLLDGIIRPVMAAFEGFSVVRADSITEPGMIDSQVIGHLLDDELVIADLSELNPNAFYEIGIRHMAERPIIHMQLDGEHLPFDVAPYRTIKFSRKSYSDVESAKSMLSNQVQSALSVTSILDNPVIRARGTKELRQSASPNERVLLDEIESLRSRLSRLEDDRSRQLVEDIRNQLIILVVRYTTTTGIKLGRLQDDIISALEAPPISLAREEVIILPMNEERFFIQLPANIRRRIAIVLDLIKNVPGVISVSEANIRKSNG